MLFYFNFNIMKTKNIFIPFRIIKNAYNFFNEDNVTKLCASLSYYTLFSLPPLLTIIIAISSLIFGDDAVKGKIFFELQSLMGKSAALQVQETLQNVKVNNNNALMAVISGFLLLLSASGVFAEIQSSIHIIWKKNAPEKTNGIWIFLKKKLMSMAMVGSIIFLLLTSLFVSTAMDFMNKEIDLLFRFNSAIIIFILNYVFSFVIVVALFYFIYYTLPTEKIGFRFSAISSFTSALLFFVGRFFIGLYISKADVASTYGAAGSLIVLMVWVYYSAAILYFGAELGKAYAMYYDDSKNEKSD